MMTSSNDGKVFQTVTSVGGLEPKWHGHFGNYIDNTVLTLHKFQAKKQICTLQ